MSCFFTWTLDPNEVAIWYGNEVFNVGLRKGEGPCSADNGSGSGIVGQKWHERQLWAESLFWDI